MPSANELHLAAKLAAQSATPLDRLPYTPEFEQLYHDFLAATGRHCTRQECWWCLIDARGRGLVPATRRRARRRRSE